MHLHHQVFCNHQVFLRGFGALESVKKKVETHGFQHVNWPIVFAVLSFNLADFLHNDVPKDKPGHNSSSWGV